MLTNEEKTKILRLKKQYSINAIWSDDTLFQRIIDELTEPFKKVAITKVLGLEARGFILGGAVAYKLKVGFVVGRKGGHMFNIYHSENDVHKEEFVDYSGKQKSLEIETHAMGIGPTDKILVVDDWFETGNQGHAAIRLVEKAGGKVVGMSVLLDQMTNEVRKSFEPHNVHALIKIK